MRGSCILKTRAEKDVGVVIKLFTFPHKGFSVLKDCRFSLKISVGLMQSES